VIFTLIHTGKYRTEDKFKNAGNTETQKKQTTQNTAYRNKTILLLQSPFMTLV